ncbi:hypothetical protein ABB37_01269 [Leptomonas pyrrhocoris]|uniref:Kinesin motor domain-containing protein n=1 Tax=Leptomonas pyrrhocoris TaxID=157538 RepID=A0A0M9G8F7_LEPPY|nr:hypothetical protein ABB37_01269 [Leptomonas pyrrhocoris]KPA84787.1 hypothetical protein ABB37_01269 [Leptomonas pyrrhocoris]|eukprot:XP_015663226.1 hypothetical protein ABB37_01269 [Leptomonas pyrrhocoris]
MSVRTYCVIPHCAREDTNFFQGVFEDGIRVLYQGRLQSLLFSHVLSPAHDYVKHINGPLLAALREGGNATLVVATPNSELVSSFSAAASSATTAPLPFSKNAGIAEVTSTTMGLYRQLFPLLFRNLENCAVARLSVVTASATERVLLDNLHDGRRIRDVTEAQHLTLHRRTSATGWGTLLQLLEERHAAMEESTTSLEGQTACVVTVDFDGYGRLVVVDTASSQELLQQLTLLLGMDGAGDQRTYPPHTPLRDLLLRNFTPQATVQVVCLPAPQDTTRQTMRVLHFGSTVEAWRINETSDIGGHNGRENFSRYFAASSTNTADEGAGVSRGPPKLFSRPAAPPSVSFDGEGRPHRGNGAERPHDNNNDTVSGVSGPPRNTSHVDSTGEGPEGPNSSSRSSITSTSGSGLQKHVGQAERGTSAINSSSHHRESTPAQLPPSSVTTADGGQQRAREAQLRRRVAMLEAQVQDMETSSQALKARRDEAVRAKERVELELRSKSRLWVDLQRAHSKAKQENADYAQLVQKLLQQVRVLEKDTSRQKRQDSAVVRELRQVREEKSELEAQLTRLRKEVMLFRRDATYRAREATLSRIVPNELSVPSHGSTRAAGAPQRQQASLVSSTASSVARTGKDSGGGPAVQRNSSRRRSLPRARRLYDTATDVEEEKSANLLSNGSSGGNADTTAEHSPARHLAPSLHPSAPGQRVTDIALEELRWRNRHLEQEVARLQERLLRSLTAATAADAPLGGRASPSSPTPPLADGGDVPLTTCKMCDVVRERVEYFQKELAHVRDEKDRLLDLLQNSPTSAAAVSGRGQSTRGDDTASEASTAVGEGAVKDGRTVHAYRGNGGLHNSPAHKGSSLSLSFLQAENTATRGVAAALLAGCASLQAQLECAQAALKQRLRRFHPSPTDPLSHISAQVLAEHHEAVAALAESLRHIAEKPATSPSPSTSISQLNGSPLREDFVQQQLLLLPPVPRTATAGNAETLAHHLTFEAERCRHLRAFIPTFAQLAVATDHLLMRLEATEPAIAEK